MSRLESVPDKARRYLTAGHVSVVEVRAGYVRAVVRGDTGLHEVEETPAGRTCTCSPFARTCSHQLAVGLVTAPVTADVPA